MPINLPLYREYIANLIIVTGQQPPEPSKSTTKIVQMASLVARTEDTAVLFKFKCHISFDELVADIESQSINHCTGVCDVRGPRLLGGVL